MTFHEYVYEQKAWKRGRTPSLFDPLPNADDVDLFMTEWAEYRFRGMSGQEVLDECSNLEREWREKMTAIIERAGQQAREKHDVV